MPITPELPPVADAPLSVLLVASQGEAALADVLTAWAAFLDGRGSPYEIVVVDDGSTDRTAERAEAAARERPHLKVVRHPIRLGFGAALRTGLAATHHPLFFYTLADPAYSPQHLPKLLEAIDQVHLVSGYRTGRSGSWRHWFLRLGYGVHLRDPYCPYKLFRREVFARIPVQSSSDFAQAEVVAKANFLGSVMTEVPLPVGAVAPAVAEEKRQVRLDARRVFFQPDFGPVNLNPPADSGESPADEGSPDQPVDAGGSPDECL